MVTVRPVTPLDSPALWSIRNQEDVRAVSNHPEEIPWSQHCAWFTRYRADPENHAYVLEVDGRVIGYCRIDHGLISIALAASVRGKGYGRRLLGESIDLHPEVLRAEVRPENDGSLRLFLNAGFTIERVDRDGSHLVRKRLTDRNPPTPSHRTP